MPDATPNRRRWGPHSLNGALQTPNCMMSPPIRSLSVGGSSSVLPKRTTRPRANTGNFSLERVDGDDEESTQEPNTLRLEDIPSQVIPRGIAARTPKGEIKVEGRYTGYIAAIVVEDRIVEIKANPSKYEDDLLVARRMLGLKRRFGTDDE